MDWAIKYTSTSEIQTLPAELVARYGSHILKVSIFWYNNLIILSYFV